jgi:hypothetical protein
MNSAEHNFTNPNALVSPEQAELINAHYSVELYTGTHGHAHDPSLDSRDNYYGKPSPLEYGEAAGVVGGMTPGRDTLLVEHSGFTESYDMAGSNTDNPLAHTMGSYLDTLAEDRRATGAVDAFQYALMKARAKGVQTLSADLDATGLAEAAAEQGMSADEYHTGSAADPRVVAVDGKREAAAAKRLFDHALSNIPEGMPVGSTTESKPRLVLLFGGNHSESLGQLFADNGVNVAAHAMKSDQEQRANEIRQAEQARRQAAAPKLSGAAMRGVSGLSGGFGTGRSRLRSGAVDRTMFRKGPDQPTG